MFSHTVYINMLSAEALSSKWSVDSVSLFCRDDDSSNTKGDRYFWVHYVYSINSVDTCVPMEGRPNNDAPHALYL